MSDSLATQIRGFHQLKAKAAEFLVNAKDNAAAGRLQAELQERDAEMAAMKKQMADMAELLQALKPKAESKKAQ